MMETDKPTNTDERSRRFVQLFSANSRRLYTYILTLLPDRNDAEEVFQEVSTTLWDKFDEFTEGSNFGAWACRIAYYKMLQMREKQRKSPRAFSQLFVESVASEFLAIDESLDAEYRALADCFQKLSDRDREIIEERYRADQMPQAIAERFNLPVRSIYKTLHRIRKSLFLCVTKSMAQGGLS